MSLFHGCFRDKLKNEKIHSIFDNKCFSMCGKVGSRSPSKDACRRASGRKCMFLQHAVVTFGICCAKPKTQATLHICYTHEHCTAFLTNHGGHYSKIMHWALVPWCLLPEPVRIIQQTNLPSFFVLSSPCFFQEWRYARAHTRGIWKCRGIQAREIEFCKGWLQSSNTSKTKMIYKGWSNIP